MVDASLGIGMLRVTSATRLRMVGNFVLLMLVRKDVMALEYNNPGPLLKIGEHQEDI